MIGNKSERQKRKVGFHNEGPSLLEVTSPENLSGFYAKTLGIQDLDDGDAFLDEQAVDLDRYLQGFEESEKEIKDQFEAYREELHQNRSAIKAAREVADQRVLNQQIHELAKRRQEGLPEYERKVTEALSKFDLNEPRTEEEDRILNEGYRQRVWGGASPPFPKGPALQLVNAHGDALTPGARGFL